MTSLTDALRAVSLVELDRTETVQDALRLVFGADQPVETGYSLAGDVIVAVGQTSDGQMHAMSLRRLLPRGEQWWNVAFWERLGYLGAAFVDPLASAADQPALMAALLKKNKAVTWRSTECLLAGQMAVTLTADQRASLDTWLALRGDQDLADRLVQAQRLWAAWDHQEESQDLLVDAIIDAETVTGGRPDRDQIEQHLPEMTLNRLWTEFDHSDWAAGARVIALQYVWGPFIRAGDRVRHERHKTGVVREAVKGSTGRTVRVTVEFTDRTCMWAARDAPVLPVDLPVEAARWLRGEVPVG